MPSYLQTLLVTGLLAVVCALASPASARDCHHYVVNTVGPDPVLNWYPCAKVVHHQTTRTVVTPVQSPVEVNIYNGTPATQVIETTPRTAVIGTTTVTVIAPENRYAYTWYPYTAAELVAVCGLSPTIAEKIVTHYDRYTWWERWRVDTYRYWGSHLRACRLLGPPALLFQ